MYDRNDSRWVKTHQSCPMCPSSDAFSIDNKGVGWCFSCNQAYNVNDSVETNDEIDDMTDLIEGGRFKSLEDRKITKQICQRFNVKVQDGNTIFPYYDKDKNLVAQKIKYPHGYRWVGDVKLSQLFGSHLFSSGRAISIVEGENDCLAFQEMMGNYPVVSIKYGANQEGSKTIKAVQEIKAQYEYFENFDYIYICFDGDSAGRYTSNKLAEVFPIGKVKLVSLEDDMDINDYLMQGRVADFKKLWWNAKDYTPAGIVAGNEGFEELISVEDMELVPYPYERLNEKTFGIRRGELVTIGAGVGQGKSLFIKEIVYHILKETPHKVGMLMLEESVKKTKQGLMSLYLNEPLHLTLLAPLARKFKFLEKILKNRFTRLTESPDINRLTEAFNNTIGLTDEDGRARVWLFDHFGSNDIDTIINRIYVMAEGYGCKYIFLDHISIVVSDQNHGDERKALDEIVTKLRTKVQEKDFALIMVSHLRRPGGKPHEEGGQISMGDIRGTAGIGQLSDVVLGLERNGQHKNEYLSNITKVRVLKNRFEGATGLTSYLHYDNKTGRLYEVDPDEVEAMEEEEKGFSPVVFDSTPMGESL